MSAYPLPLFVVVAVASRAHFDSRLIFVSCRHPLLPQLPVSHLSTKSIHFTPLPLPSPPVQCHAMPCAVASVSEQLKERSAEVSLHKSYAASADAKAAQMATEWAAARAKLMTLELQLKAQTAQTESDANQLKQLESVTPPTPLPFICCVVCCGM
jgi:hypothetical protein